MSTADRSPEGSTFRLLKQPVFRALWIASLASNVGTWMHEVGAGWLMTSLTTSPTLVGLLETALTLPIFLFSLPAGALADILDRRRILIATQSWMIAVAALMAITALTGTMTPAMLLVLTFVLNIGAAMNGPAWQAILQEIVGRTELSSAVALGSVGFNIARAFGPALGGFVIAASGPWAVFALNSLSFIGVVIVLYRWRREHHESILPAERMLGAMRAGLRYVRYAPMLQAVLIRTAAFIFFGSAMWATLPYIVRHEMGLSPVDFGVFIGVFGVGAVTGAGVMAKLRTWFSVDTLVRLATVLFAFLLVTLGLMQKYPAVCAAMFAGGIAWMILMSSFNLGAQIAAPPWVRARAMAVYILVFFGGFAGGSAIWGVLAAQAGTSTALTIAAAGAILGMVSTMKFRLVIDGSVDLSPSMHWVEPALAFEPHPEQGPVMVTVEYRIDEENAMEFSNAVHALSRVRKRDGAIQWGIFRDVADPKRYVEHFVVESWVEHMRQHERVTVADKAFEERVHAFHRGPGTPKVEHFVYLDNQ
ncbi:MAG TPA: MFS transporter [Bacteroidota bacterium]|jgi:MFS family permease|nr:MFS transporter [Bacteroidota bacterium]